MAEGNSRDTGLSLANSVSLGKDEVEVPESLCQKRAFVMCKPGHLVGLSHP